jgi:lipoate---protein ligase
MILIDNENNTNPAINLALEEHALNTLELKEDHILFYINEPSIIIGKHQNTHEEINHDYVKTNKLHVVRRISGGGTVYHDHGNLNFSFLTRSNDKVFNDYRTFTQPIIKALHALNVPAALTGRNDIVANGEKISGNAQYRRAQKMFCHGTLLFDTNLDNVAKALNVKADKIQSKGIKSIRSRVTNIREFLEDACEIQNFKNHLTQYLFNHGDIKLHQFSKTDWEAIRKLADEKYSNWDWNFGKSPKFDIQCRERLSMGEIDVRMNVENSKISELKIYGDFFAEGDTHELEVLLIDHAYEKESIQDAIKDVQVSKYIAGLSNEAFIGLLF